MKLLPLPYRSNRFGTLLFLLFCGCMEVLAMAPEMYHHLPTEVSTEWVVDSEDHPVIDHLEYNSAVSTGFIYSLRQALPNSFSATLRWYAERLSRLYVQQWEQFLHHKLNHLHQVAFQQAHRIDLFEDSAASS